jgi:adenine/guanine phosphoribosyltransferase-like PRPP-binding protein
MALKFSHHVSKMNDHPKKIIGLIYNRDFYITNSIQYFGRHFLDALPPQVDRLLSTGSSGCAIATALLVLSDRHLEHTVVRKRHEIAHYPYAGRYPNRDCKCAIVDDFIASGDSIDRIIDYAKIRDMNIMSILVTDCPLAIRTRWLPIEVIIVR